MPVRLLVLNGAVHNALSSVAYLTSMSSIRQSHPGVLVVNGVHMQVGSV